MINGLLSTSGHSGWERMACTTHLEMLTGTANHTTTRIPYWYDQPLFELGDMMATQKLHETGRGNTNMEPTSYPRID